MNKKIFSAIVSIAMTATMFPMTVFAEDEVQKGGGVKYEGLVTLEGIVDKDIYSVELPTSVATDFSFIIDPQGLITATGTSSAADSTGNISPSSTIVTHSKYGTAEFESGKTMYFNSFSEASKPSEYTSKSKTVTVTNKSSKGVNASVDFVISGVDGITFASDNTFTITDGTTTTDITAPSMFLEAEITPYLLTVADPANAPGSGTTAGTAKTQVFSSDASDADKASASFSGDDVIKLTQSNYDAYKYTYTPANPSGTPPTKEKYEFVPDPSKTSYVFEKFEITLEGAVNDSADWFKLVDGNASGFSPKIDIVFDITLDGYESTGTGSTTGDVDKTSISSADETIAITNGKAVKSIMLNVASIGLVDLLTPDYSSYCSFDGTNITLVEAAFEAGSNIVIIFEDDTEATVTFNKS